MDSILSYFTNNIMLTCILAGTAIMTVWWLKFQKKLNMKWYIAPILGIGHFVLGAITLKLWGGFESSLGFDQNATMKLFGGVFLIPPVYYLAAKLTKRDTALIMDICAVCCIIGFIGRGSCLANGCCQGTLIFPDGSVRWPLNEIEIIGSFLFVCYFWQRVYKGKTKGMALPAMYLFYGSMRFVLEWFREEYTTVGFLHLAHIWSLLAIAIGTGIYIKMSLKTQKSKKSGKRLMK